MKKITMYFKGLPDWLAEHDKAVFIMAIVTGCFFIACVMTYAIGVGTMQSNLDTQSQALYNLQNQVDMKISESESNRAKLVQGATGLNTQRVTVDTKVAETFIEKALTWSNGATYDAVRAEMMTTYGLTEDSPFMKVFMPINVKTADGQFNYIDTHHSNCQYEDMDVYVSSISTDVYSYFSFVTWSTSDMTGNEAKSTCIVTYDINVDGKLSNLSAYTMAN